MSARSLKRLEAMAMRWYAWLTKLGWTEQDRLESTRLQAIFRACAAHSAAKKRKDRK
jgi:hypothetical protein